MAVAFLWKIRKFVCLHWQIQILPHIVIDKKVIIILLIIK